MKQGVSAFFSASESREERWRELHRAAKSLAAGGGQADKAKQEAGALLKELSPLEDLCGYPGPRLMAQLAERMKDGDCHGLARLTQRISLSLLANSYRDDPEAWKSDQEDDPHVPAILPPSIGRGQARKPYCEVLIVSPSDRSTWAAMREGVRKLRRETDQFAVEPVTVGNFEAAVLAVLVNFNIQAVVLFDGFNYPSQTPVADLRELLTTHMPQGGASRDVDLGMLLTRAIHAIRPELDVYL